MEEVYSYIEGCLDFFLNAITMRGRRYNLQFEFTIRQTQVVRGMILIGVLKFTIFGMSMGGRR